MGKYQNRRQKRKKVQDDLKKLSQHEEQLLFIHYSCESFYDIQDGRSPRITSIAVRHKSTGQTKSFSIHKIAEQKQISIEDIEKEYNLLERQMLDDYFEFIRSRPGYNFAHWNMRDGGYGFAAIEHRYKVLGGEPYQIDDESKYDLSRSLKNLYGDDYIGDPRFHCIVENNNITQIGFMLGEDEAEAFKNKEYVKLHQSTLRKVFALESIFDRTTDGTLLVDAKWHEIHGIHPEILAELIQDHWFFVLFMFLLAVFGVVLGVVGLFP